MSHSVPSDSSADTTFLVGADLVEFDRRDLPIYHDPESRWAEACFDEAPYGAPLDRLFGEPGDVHVDGVAIDNSVRDDHALTAIGGEDPLVVLGALNDGLALPPPPAIESATVFDFGADSHAAAHLPIAHLHDGWNWDASGADWTFDFHS